eukprot:TRINITY_DN762_c0_g1_i1.p1 TRINITY_DN762_c0_g1~~TRINITY_DN762_c0_g1_i1.p1  ORF type:complete len:490 (-),score=125.28 TRINITY_DN762_c0_g1_i1:101-1570(-)
MAVLNAENGINTRVLAAEYAVRGPVVAAAERVEKELEKHDFDQVIYCNIGNPQQLKQKPLTFGRQVLALATYPDLLAKMTASPSAEMSKLFPQEAVDRATKYCPPGAPGLGAYSMSRGLPQVRREVADFIEQRDGAPAGSVDPEHIFLTNGASDGISKVMSMLIRDGNDGILTPVPQYPLYSATITLLGGSFIGYPLNEGKEWGLDLPSLQQAVADSPATPRAMVVINPGNPTGNILSYDDMVTVVKFCHEHNLCLLADEVYQTNIYRDDRPFYSFRKVVQDVQKEDAKYKDFELVSFHSTSKGFLGECGYRGGYMEVYGLGQEAMETVNKLISIGLCSNVSGQVMTGLMVNPPTGDSEVAKLYAQERDDILASLRRRATKLSAALNSLDGVSCVDVAGAMYAFPQFTIPDKAVQHAEANGMAPDLMYCSALVEEKGIVVVPGSGFKDGPSAQQAPFHFRVTILPPEEQMDDFIDRFTDFHTQFMKKWT